MSLVPVEVSQDSGLYCDHYYHTHISEWLRQDMRMMHIKSMRFSFRHNLNSFKSVKSACCEWDTTGKAVMYEESQPEIFQVCVWRTSWGCCASVEVSHPRSFYYLADWHVGYFLFWLDDREMKGERVRRTEVLLVGIKHWECLAVCTVNSKVVFSTVEKMPCETRKAFAEFYAIKFS